MRVCVRAHTHTNTQSSMHSHTHKEIYTHTHTHFYAQSCTQCVTHTHIVLRTVIHTMSHTRTHITCTHPTPNPPTISISRSFSLITSVFQFQPHFLVHSDKADLTLPIIIYTSTTVHLQSNCIFSTEEPWTKDSLTCEVMVGREVVGGWGWGRHITRTKLDLE